VQARNEQISADVML